MIIAEQKLERKRKETEQRLLQSTSEVSKSLPKTTERGIINMATKKQAGKESKGQIKVLLDL